MVNHFRVLKKYLRRHILKFENKNSLMNNFTASVGVASGQSWRLVTRLALYVMTFCLLSMTLWMMYASIDDVITINFTSSNEMVKAVYKCAYENQDNTVDLVFNIPKGGESLIQQVNLHLNISKVAKQRADKKLPQEVASAPEKRPVVKSSYPVSLDVGYAINIPNICPVGKQVDYLIIIHSATVYFARRRAIRETFGGGKLFGNIIQHVVFLLGLTTDPATTKSIHEEAFLHRDIVQGQFIDSYHNLTHKGVLGYRWVSEHCPQAKIVIKIDDNVFVNPFKLVQDVLPAFRNKTRHLACHVRRAGTSPILRGKGKWQVHDDEFRGYQYYPFDYCNGYFVVVTGDLIRPMLNAAQLNPFFWIDDVYLFGMLPATVGSTTFVDYKDILTLKFDTGKRCYEEKGSQCKYVAVSQWRPDEPEKFWYLVLSNLTLAVKKDLNIFGLS